MFINPTFKVRQVISVMTSRTRNIDLQSSLIVHESVSVINLILLILLSIKDRK